MLAFAVCLVFGAHPDFWLNDAEFEKRNSHISALVDGIENTRDHIVRLQKRIERGEEDTVYLNKQIAHQNDTIARWLLDIDDARVQQRTRALINFRHRRR